jgi:hypothetical protein
MGMRPWIGALAGAVSATLACIPPSGLALAQQTAQDLNVSERFGQSEEAMDHVAPEARDDFVTHHKDWGRTIQVADVELTGMHAHGEHDVDVLVRVGWYRATEQELRTTTVQQGWKDKKGWQLVSEKRVDGDVGLLGEAVVYESPPQVERAPAQFPTVRLGP